MFQIERVIDTSGADTCFYIRGDIIFEGRAEHMSGFYCWTLLYFCRDGNSNTDYRGLTEV